MSRVAIIIGHTTKDTGSYSALTDMTENKFMRIVAGDLISEGANVDVFYRNPNVGYSSQMKEVVNILNNGNYRFVLELHHNAFDSPKARGVECLVFYKSIKGREIARKFNKTMNDLTGIPIRGTGIVEIKTEKDRGGWGIVNCKHPYVLIESHFCTSEDDCRIVNPYIVSKAIMEVINGK